MTTITNGSVVLVTALLAVGCTRPNPYYDPGWQGHGRGEADSGMGADSGSERTLAGFRITVEVQGAILEDEPFEIRVSPVDEAGAAYPDYHGSPRLWASRGALEFLDQGPPEVDGSGTRTYLVSLNREGEVAIKAADGDVLGESPPILVRHGKWEVNTSPVLSWGVATEDEWDGWEVSQPAVGVEAGHWLMFYRGRAKPNSDKRSGIGKVDLDPLTGIWERARHSPVVPDRYDGDDDLVATYSGPAFVKLGTQWMMFLATRTFGDVPTTTIGLKTSVDGLDWVEGGTLIAPDVGASRPEAEVYDPTVVYQEDEGYQMWFTIRYEDGGTAIGRAVSQDGRVWERAPEQPVLTPDRGAWDGELVESPSVLLDRGVYRMWYAGSAASGDQETDRVFIGYATSSDGIHWEKSPDNPVLAPPDMGFAKYKVAHPCAVLEGGSLQLFYAGYQSRWRIGLAVTRSLD